MQLILEAEGKKQKAEINEFEDRMKSRVVTLVEKHDKALRSAEQEYSQIQGHLLFQRNVLKVRDVTDSLEAVHSEKKTHKLTAQKYK